jgi:hypothetical protein
MRTADGSTAKAPRAGATLAGCLNFPAGTGPALPAPGQDGPA